MKNNADFAVVFSLEICLHGKSPGYRISMDIHGIIQDTDHSGLRFIAKSERTSWYFYFRLKETATFWRENPLIVMNVDSYFIQWNWTEQSVFCGHALEQVHCILNYLFLWIWQLSWYWQYFGSRLCSVAHQDVQEPWKIANQLQI